MWYEIREQSSSEDEKTTARVCVPTGSKWFEGHFPGNPLLPGIAQLGMVFDLIARRFDVPIQVVDVSRVRFKQMIMPDDQVVVLVEPSAKREGAFSFRITKDNELVCNGMMAVKAV